MVLYTLVVWDMLHMLEPSLKHPMANLCIGYRIKNITIDTGYVRHVGYVGTSVEASKV